jgi:DNA-binding CsgD family transcriptional regulator
MVSADAAIGDVIDAIGTSDFVGRAAHSLRRYAGFDLTAAVLHLPAGPARLLADNFDDIGARSAVETYARVTHPINPMLARRGAVRARDFTGVPATLAALHPHVLRDSEEEMGFRTNGWPARQEEIGLYLPGWGGVIEIGFYRRRGRHAASNTTMRALHGLSRPVIAAFERHRALTRAPAERGLLSQREAEVHELLLRGCSSEAIALRLTISRHTVKDHRKQIFRKLGIGSLAELFAAAR